MNDDFVNIIIMHGCFFLTKQKNNVGEVVSHFETFSFSVSTSHTRKENNDNFFV